VKRGLNYFGREAAANFIFLLEASDSKNEATAHICKLKYGVLKIPMSPEKIGCYRKTFILELHSELASLYFVHFFVFFHQFAIFKSGEM
jgi:hypothetical protein